MYQIEVRLADKRGWHTPAEARAWYKKYARDGITVHWWNSPGAVKDSDHDNIVNYILGKAQRATGSVNYVLSNKKITLMVNPDNVAWASQGGNPTTVSVEFSPHLNAEGYKKAGWLINELFNPKNGRYKKSPRLWKHSDWFSTQCPGTLSLSKMLAEAKKWANGDYNPKPAPTPKPEPVPPSTPLNTFHLWKEGEIEYVLNKDSYLYDLTKAKDWNTIGKSKSFKKGERVVITGHVHNNAIDRDYYITRYSFDNKNATGFHPADLEIYVPPRPVPEPPKEPELPSEPVEPTDPDPVEPTEPDRNAIMAFFKMLRDLIDSFLGKFKK